MDDLRKVKRAIGITGGKALSRRNASSGKAAQAARDAARRAAECGAATGTKKGAVGIHGALSSIRESPHFRERLRVWQRYFFGASAGAAGAAGAAAALSAGAAAGGGGGGGGASSFFAQADRTIVPASSSPRNSDTYLRIGSHSFPVRVYPLPDNGWGTYAAKYSTSKKRCNHFFCGPGNPPDGLHACKSRRSTVSKQRIDEALEFPV